MDTRRFWTWFFITEKNTILEYKCTNFYHPDDEKCIIWNDKKIGMKLP